MFTFRFPPPPGGVPPPPPKMIRPNPIRWHAANDRYADPVAAPLPLCRCGNCRFWIEPVDSGRPSPALAICVVRHGGHAVYTGSGAACSVRGPGAGKWWWAPFVEPAA